MNAESILYQKNLVPAAEAPDGETPTMIYATKEINGFAVFIMGYEIPTKLIHFFPMLPGSREKAIEEAVRFQLEGEGGSGDGLTFERRARR